MGAVKQVLVTGGSGFIGRAIQVAAHSAGLKVVAPNRAQVDFGAADANARLQDVLDGCDVVIHLAAAMGGDAAAHERVTLNGTRALLSAMQAKGVTRLVLVSSMACYALEPLTPGERLHSDSALDTAETARDSYAYAKISQEALAQNAGLAHLTILRPGIVYDRNRLLNAHLGVGIGPLLLSFPSKTVLPMCHVSRLAQIAVTAAQDGTSSAQLVTDEDLPTRADVIARLRQTGWPKMIVPFPSGLLKLAARIAAPVSHKMPGLLRTRVLEQRLSPLGRLTAQAVGTWMRGGQPT